MATVEIDLNFKVPREIIREEVEIGSLAAANFVKKKADQIINIGKIRRPVYKSGKYKNKTWTARRPGQLKRSGRANRSKFKGGGSIVRYGSFNAFYGFMHHWGTKKSRENPFLNKALISAKKDIETEITKRIKSRLK
jgi:hypothetical protein